MKAKKIMIVLAMLCYVTIHYGQYVSVQNGDWSNGSTWNTGTAPPSFGNYTVVINHNVTISATIQGAAWQLTVNAGGYLHDIGCQQITTWDGNALWTNYGTIDVYQMSGPGKVVNYGTMIIDRVGSASSNSRWTNKTGATITCVQATFDGNADFINQGTFTANCVGTGCWGLSGWGLEFNGDSLVNSGSISTCTLGITGGTYLVNAVSCPINITGNVAVSGCIWTNAGTITMGEDFDPSSTTVTNAATGTITATGDFLLVTGTTITNNGDLNMNDFRITSSTLTNNGTLDASGWMINEASSTITNNGCNCFATPGVITVQGDLDNYATIQNNGLFNVYGTSVENYGPMGTNVCGRFNMPAAVIVANGTGNFFGVSIICAQSLTCWGCIISPGVMWTCNTPATNCSSAAILPIELLYFTAEPDFKNDEVALKWATASERENHAFEVERSVDNVNWEIVYTQPGSGSSQMLQEYTGADTEPIRGISYYRLKQVDMDGDYTYSETVSVNWSDGEVHVFPNPANNELTISGVKSEPAGLWITSIEGAVVNPPYNYDTAGQMIKVDVTGLASGVYLVRIHDAYFQFVVH